MEKLVLHLVSNNVIFFEESAKRREIYFQILPPIIQTSY